jgi:hypothetical protein
MSEQDQDTCECGSRDIVGGDSRRVYCARCYEVNFGSDEDVEPEPELFQCSCQCGCSTEVEGEDGRCAMCQEACFAP